MIDLSGYTDFNRLSVFALKPAPIQISWIGWLGTTGYPTMDYFIADEFCVPYKEKYEKQFIEQIIRMPNIWEVITPPNTKSVPPPPEVVKNILLLAVLIIQIKLMQKLWIYGVKF